jgi:hypothetical protein
MKTGGFFNDYLNNQPELFSMLLWVFGLLASADLEWLN